MNSGPAPAPDSTAMRVAMWRALHVQEDAAPQIAALAAGPRFAMTFLLPFLCASLQVSGGEEFLLAAT